MAMHGALWCRQAGVIKLLYEYYAVYARRCVYLRFIVRSLGRYR